MSMKLMPTSKRIVEIKVKPVKGRVNRTVEKELMRLFKRKVAIISGFHVERSAF